MRKQGDSPKSEPLKFHQNHYIYQSRQIHQNHWIHHNHQIGQNQHIHQNHQNSLNHYFARITKKHYNHQNKCGFKVTLVTFMGFLSDVHSLMCPQMVCKENFHFSLNVTYLKSLALSQIWIFISGTETMICHLKRKGLEVGVWDGNYLTVS